VPNGTAVQGENIPGFVENILHVLTDIHLDLHDAFGAGNWATAEYTFSATNNGLIPVPGTTGKSFSVRTVTVFELLGDKILRSSDYYDSATILKQLGVMPEPGGAPAASPPAGTPTS
jgi:hypothetical protein